MKLVRVLFAAFLFSVSCSAHSADQATAVLDLIHKAGFVGCDKAVLEEFKAYIDSAANGRMSGDYFDKSGKFYSLTATWGQIGDSVYQRTIFQREGKMCGGFRTLIVSLKNSCMEFKEKNPKFKLIQTSADFNWTANENNVEAILQNTSGGGCNVIYQWGVKYPSN